MKNKKKFVKKANMWLVTKVMQLGINQTKQDQWWFSTEDEADKKIKEMEDEEQSEQKETKEKGKKTPNGGYVREEEIEDGIIGLGRDYWIEDEC